MEKQYIMTVDFGTQSVRTGIIDSTGNVVAMTREKYDPAYVSPKLGYAEQDPNEYYRYFVKTCKNLWKDNSKYKDKLVGLAMSCFRDTAVMCDENMNPLRPAILWLDQRRAEGKEKLPLIARGLFKIAGASETVDLNRKRTPAQWVKENEPNIWNKVKRYMTISTYITYLLTGEYKDSIANYAGHFPTDFKHRKFYTNDKHLTGQIYGVKHSMLPGVVKVGDIIGTITKKCSSETGIPEGLKLYSIGSDKSCDTLGTGSMYKGIASISCGTASSIEITSKKFLHPDNFLPSYPSVIDGYFNAEVQVYRGYWMVEWFIKEFAELEKEVAKKKKTSIEMLLDEKLKEAPAGCNGLLLQPYWGPGLSRPIVRGTIVGFTDLHTKSHLYRSIVEGINYELKEGLMHLDKVSKVKTKELRISSGGSQSEEICQIVADIFNLPVSKVQTSETSSLGAAIAGFIGAGVFPDLKSAIDAMVHVGKTYNPNPKHVKRYDYLFNHCYKKIYPALKGIYKKIKQAEIYLNNN